MGLQLCLEDEGALVAERTFERIGTGEGFEKLVPGLRFLELWLRRHEKKTGLRDEGLPVSIGQYSIMTDLDKACLEDVLEETPNELEARERCGECL